MQVVRFDRIFAGITPQTLSATKSKYPIFFPKQFNDSVWIAKMNDTLQDELEAEVVKKFPDNPLIKENLEDLFRHIKYYFPKMEVPKVYTAISDVDYQNKAILADSMLVISIDTYLGSNHKFYEGIQQFITKTMEPPQMVQDVATQYAKKYVAPPKQRRFLDQIIYYGKGLYLKDLWLPKTLDAEKIGYTESKYQWAQENEDEMWRYFVENELLYSTDPKLVERFLAPAPFSKFYLEIDNDSPGMVGRYIGWQIVRAFMEKNKIDVRQLMVMDAEEIFKESKYKPKK